MLLTVSGWQPQDDAANTSPGGLVFHQSGPSTPKNVPSTDRAAAVKRGFRTPVSRGLVHFFLHRKKSFLFSALYAAFIFGGRHLMNKRAKFELRKPLVLWSLTLAVFR